VLYLLKTDVPHYGQLQQLHHAIASMIEIDGRNELGGLRTIFGELGGIRAEAERRRAKFLVGEASEVWHRPTCTDARGRARLDDIRAAEREGRLEDRRITVARTVVSDVVVDGNKRAIAIHEFAAADIVLPAYLVQSAPGYPTLPLP
jgi:hypothetical protein